MYTKCYLCTTVTYMFEWMMLDGKEKLSCHLKRAGKKNERKSFLDSFSCYALKSLPFFDTMLRPF